MRLQYTTLRSMISVQKLASFQIWYAPVDINLRKPSCLSYNRDRKEQTLNMSVPVPVGVGDVVELRKLHPCGGRNWSVTRVGADIGMRCVRCGRRVMLTRDEFERRWQRTLHSDSIVDVAKVSSQEN